MVCIVCAFCVPIITFQMIILTPLSLSLAVKSSKQGNLKNVVSVLKITESHFAFTTWFFTSKADGNSWFEFRSIQIWIQTSYKFKSSLRVVDFKCLPV